ncbi:hypothetical protein PFAG_01231 [Plasmodium falciparum Santa Lucia]|uniref:Uncharacterized protein n=1 Tax=Plasmodium falciparum Santa Lucia TaxID=478859 RepID=W7FMG3_PLAFA|nr:hypothetical protein PFAG_01231 [Plasmodium falciparum Santa Lucia]
MNESYMLHELKEGPLQICIFRNFIIESLFNNMYYINIYKCEKKKIKCVEYDHLMMYEYKLNFSFFFFFFLFIYLYLF